MFKSKNGLAPTYINDLIKPASEQPRNTRFSLSNNYIVPELNTELYRSSFSYSGPKLWNTLPKGTKECQSVFKFKNKYKSQYFRDGHF